MTQAFHVFPVASLKITMGVVIYDFTARYEPKIWTRYFIKINSISQKYKGRKALDQNIIRCDSMVRKFP